MSSANLYVHDLGEGSRFQVGRLPDGLVLSAAQFEQLWDMHPDEYHTIHMVNGPVKTPRFQQAFGMNYRYTGAENVALPVPDLLKPMHEWLKEQIDPRLNGLLVNWYDGALGHYIGRHRDSTANMVVGAPIVTLSFGAERAFRLRPWKGKGFRDFPACDGTVFVLPFETNKCWTHEVLHRAKDSGRRISVTARAFRK